MSTFLDALACNNTKTPPIWMMRQAGRYHKHYQNLKQSHTFEELCKKPELASEVAFGPVDDFGFDAGILFSDILFILEGIGYDVTFAPSPIITQHNRKNAQDAHFMGFQSQAIVQTKKRLGNIPLIGFVGGLSTLYYFVKEQVPERPQKHQHIGYFCEDMLEIYISNIFLQIDSGIDAIAILDSKSAKQTIEYWHFVQKIVDTISKKSNIPIIYYTDGTWQNTLKGVSCLGFNSEYNIVQTLQENFGVSVQGTFNEKYLTLPENECAKLIDEYFQYVVKNTTPQERYGWVNAIGHGIPKESKENNIRYFIKKGKEIKNS